MFATGSPLEPTRVMRETVSGSRRGGASPVSHLLSQVQVTSRNGTAGRDPLRLMRRLAPIGAALAVSAALIVAGCGGGGRLRRRRRPPAPHPRRRRRPSRSAAVAPGSPVTAGPNTPKNVARALAGSKVVVVALPRAGHGRRRRRGGRPRSVRGDKRWIDGAQFFVYDGGQGPLRRPGRPARRHRDAVRGRDRPRPHPQPTCGPGSWTPRSCASRSPTRPTPRRRTAPPPEGLTHPPGPPATGPRRPPGGRSGPVVAWPRAALHPRGDAPSRVPGGRRRRWRAPTRSGSPAAPRAATWCGCSCAWRAGGCARRASRPSGAAPPPRRPARPAPG